LEWVRELAEIQRDILHRLSDLEEIKVDFLQNRIFVFTPKGDVLDLPEDATPVDFAYHIHSDIGNKCGGALINDKIMSLDTPLKNGDVVEILIDKNRKGPNEDWLQFVKTHSAAYHIKSYNKSRVTEWLKLMIPKSKNK
jgi:GTP pyrophosphokinase